METINVISQFTQTIGIPGAMCFFLGFYIYKIQTKSNDIIAENTKTLTVLTKMIERLLDKFDVKKEEE